MCKEIAQGKVRYEVQLQYRLEVLLNERLAAEVLAGEVLPPRHLLPVRASSLQPRAVSTLVPKNLHWEDRNKAGKHSGQ